MIENPHEVDTLETYQALLISKREVFLRSIWNESTNNVNYREVEQTVKTMYFLTNFFSDNRPVTGGLRDGGGGGCE